MGEATGHGDGDKHAGELSYRNLKADLDSGFLITCNQANLNFYFFVPWP